MEQLIDIGINLMHKSFARDRDALLERARRAGVGQLIVTGTDVRASEGAARLAAQHPRVLYSTAGVHPHDAKTCDGRTLNSLQRLAAQPQVVAIGECGLDYDRNFSPPAVQRLWFEQQLQLAQALHMPLFLHERAAHGDFLAILRRYPDCARRAVVHCFTGTALEAQAYLDLGCLIGVTGFVCDERRNHALCDALRVIPLERLLVETDAPFMLPRDLPDPPRDRRNEPMYLPHVARRLAGYMGCTPGRLADQTTQNAKRFFGI